MSKAEEFFISLSKEIPNVTIGKMFGALCMKTASSKSVAMMWKDNIVIKLTGDTVSEATGLSDTKPFEPMQGKPMKEWYQVSFQHKEKWEKLVLLSLENVQAIQAKTPSRKKNKK